MDYAIIVAGGKGMRMGSDVPKQFLVVGGKPVLMHTLERFRSYSPTLNIILVLPAEQQSYWQKLCSDYGFSVNHQLACGGSSRFHSVGNGLSLIPDDEQGIVSVHDGVRPFASPDVIANCYQTARTKRAVVPVVPVVETLRQVSAQESHTVARSDYRLVQTPQVFDIQLFKAAYKQALAKASESSTATEGPTAAAKAVSQQAYGELFTDDASVVEAYGHPITLVEGNRENIKITTPFDLRIAEALMGMDEWK